MLDIEVEEITINGRSYAGSLAENMLDATLRDVLRAWQDRSVMQRDKVRIVVQIVGDRSMSVEQILMGMES